MKEIHLCCYFGTFISPELIQTECTKLRIRKEPLLQESFQNFFSLFYKFIADYGTTEFVKGTDDSTCSNKD